MATLWKRSGRAGLARGCDGFHLIHTRLLDDGDDDLDESKQSCDDPQSILELLTRRMILLSGYELQVPPFVVFAGRLLRIAVVKAPRNSIVAFEEFITPNK
jgi:hypothetical protein